MSIAIAKEAGVGLPAIDPTNGWHLHGDAMSPPSMEFLDGSQATIVLEDRVPSLVDDARPDLFIVGASEATPIITPNERIRRMALDQQILRQTLPPVIEETVARAERAKDNAYVDGFVPDPYVLSVVTDYWENGAFQLAKNINIAWIQGTQDRHYPRWQHQEALAAWCATMPDGRIELEYAELSRDDAVRAFKGFIAPLEDIPYSGFLLSHNPEEQKFGLRLQHSRYELGLSIFPDMTDHEASMLYGYNRESLERFDRDVAERLAMLGYTVPIFSQQELQAAPLLAD